MPAKLTHQRHPGNRMFGLSNIKLFLLHRNIGVADRGKSRCMATPAWPNRASRQWSCRPIREWFEIESIAFVAGKPPFKLQRLYESYWPIDICLALAKAVRKHTLSPPPPRRREAATPSSSDFCYCEADGMICR